MISKLATGLSSGPSLTKYAWRPAVTASNPSFEPLQDIAKGFVPPPAYRTSDYGKLRQRVLEVSRKLDLKEDRRIFGLSVGDILVNDVIGHAPGDLVHFAVYIGKGYLFEYVTPVTDQRGVKRLVFRMGPVAQSDEPLYLLKQEDVPPKPKVIFERVLKVLEDLRDGREHDLDGIVDNCETFAMYLRTGERHMIPPLNGAVLFDRFVYPAILAGIAAKTTKVALGRRRTRMRNRETRATDSETESDGEADRLPAQRRVQRPEAARWRWGASR
jgi:hypothetical protein